MNHKLIECHGYIYRDEEDFPIKNKKLNKELT